MQHSKILQQIFENFKKRNIGLFRGILNSCKYKTKTLLFKVLAKEKTRLLKGGHKVERSTIESKPLTKISVEKREYRKYYNRLNLYNVRSP